MMFDVLMVHELMKMVGNSILPPPPSPMDIYIYIYCIYIYNLFFEIHCFLQAFVKKQQMDLSFYKMPLLYIFGKVMPNIFPVLRFHQYIYWKLSPPNIKSLSYHRLPQTIVNSIHQTKLWHQTKNQRCPISSIPCLYISFHWCWHQTS